MSVGMSRAGRVASCCAVRMAQRRAWDRAAWFILRLQVLRDVRVGRDRCVVWLRGQEMRDRAAGLRAWRRAAFFVARLSFLRVASHGIVRRAVLRLSEGGGGTSDWTSAERTRRTATAPMLPLVERVATATARALPRARLAAMATALALPLVKRAVTATAPVTALLLARRTATAIARALPLARRTVAATARVLP